MINEHYLKVIPQIKSILKNQGSIELKQFLNQSDFDKTQKFNSKLKLKKLNIVLEKKHSLSPAKINDEINSFIKELIGSAPKNWEVWSFSASDYTVINDHAIEKAGFDIIIDLTKKWSPEFGGSIVYVDGSGEYTKIEAEENKLIIMKRNKGEHRFVQYVNNLAKNKARNFLIARI